MRTWISLFPIFFLAFFQVVPGRVFHPCELGLILLNQGIHYDTLGDWICLAHAASFYRSSKIGGHYSNPTNSQYGIFQLSNFWYCYDESRPLPQHNECKLNCSELVDDDLVDDINCAKLLYKRGNYTFKHWDYIFDEHCGNSSGTDGNIAFHRECDFQNGLIPKIVSDEMDVTVYWDQIIPGQEVLQCVGQGSLPIDIRWFQNRQLINSSTDPDFEIKLTMDLDENQTISTVCIRHPNFGLNGTVRVLSCEAENKYGREAKDFLLKIANPPIDQKPKENIPIELMIPIFIIVITAILIGTTFYFKYIKNEHIGLSSQEISSFHNGADRVVFEGENDDGEVARYLNANLLSEPYDKKVEIKKSDLTFDKKDVIGSGQFGLVYKGIHKDKQVAVKTIKPGSTKTDLTCLLSELKILIYVQGHPNVVDLVGAYTKELDRGVAFLLLEYYPLGNLMKYLQQFRSDHPGDLNCFNCCDLQTMLGWSYQIASAMEFLSSRKVVHGDLATRNILLQSPTLIKVTDFGLSRKVHDYAIYVRGEEGVDLLPWRWLAPETLRELMFSSATDVWSYGITLWEIFSFAAVPYPGLNYSTDFLRQLEDGLRLTKPKRAVESVFKIMDACWRLDPNERPSFTRLRQDLYLEMKTTSSEIYIELDNTDAKDAAYFTCVIIP